MVNPDGPTKSIRLKEVSVERELTAIANNGHKIDFGCLSERVTPLKAS